jgi:hypothetical protein
VVRVTTEVRIIETFATDSQTFEVADRNPQQVSSILGPNEANLMNWGLPSPLSSGMLPG